MTGEELSLDIEKTCEDGHIESGKLKSSAGTYPIVNGVPRFVLSQSSTEEQTVEAFGDQWHEADEAILHYGQDEEYFSAYFSPLEPNAFGNAVVLDAGCGNGRLLEYALGFEPRMIVGIDYSRAVDLAFTRTRHRENALVVQGSLLAPPLRRNGYELIYSLGVVHHLESPEKGLRELGDLLEDNGVMHVWPYSREGNELYLALVGPLRRLSRWLPNGALWLLSTLLGCVTWPYLFLCSCISARSSTALLPLQQYLAFLYGLGFGVYKVVIHDQLAPSIAFYPTREDIACWTRNANLKIFHQDMRTTNSWRLGLRREGMGQ